MFERSVVVASAALSLAALILAGTTISSLIGEADTTRPRTWRPRRAADLADRPTLGGSARSSAARAAQAEKALAVVWKLPGHESFNFTSYIDAQFTPDQVSWLEHYKPGAPPQPGGGARDWWRPPKKEASAAEADAAPHRGKSAAPPS